MPTLHVTLRNGECLTVEGRPGLTMMDLIRNTGREDPFAVCGGGCSCGTCHVFVDQEWIDRVGDVTAFEDDMLDMSPHRGATSRLSCQIVMTDALDGVSVTVAPAQA